MAEDSRFGEVSGVGRSVEVRIYRAQTGLCVCRLHEESSTGAGCLRPEGPVLSWSPLRPELVKARQLIAWIRERRPAWLRQERNHVLNLAELRANSPVSERGPP